MKKCPDCGMVIANQAIRCPKCKYTFTSADESAGGNDSAAVTPQAAAVSAAATGKSDKVAGIMPMIEVNKDNVDTLYEQLKAAIVKRKTEFDHFIDFLENRTSWLTAPAEVKGSLACEKGLLIRSVSVAKQLGKHKPISIPYWMAWCMAKVGDLLGSKAPINSYKLEKMTKSLTFSNEKARKELGWEPLDVLTNYKI